MLCTTACRFGVDQVTRGSAWARLGRGALLGLGLWSGLVLAQKIELDVVDRAPDVGVAAAETPPAIALPLTTPAEPSAAVCPEPSARLPRCEPPADVGALHSTTPDPTIALLEFADRMRSASPAERARELARATPAPKTNGRGDTESSNGNASAQQQLRLAIVLGQIRPGADLARAQQLAQQVVNSALPEAQPIKPLARLLTARFAEQRRLEEQLDRAERQLRDQRLRLARANQRLEAVRAIERSLGATPAERSTAPVDASSAVPAGPR